jgi:hypothetical protein
LALNLFYLKINFFMRLPYLCKPIPSLWFSLCPTQQAGMNPVGGGHVHPQLLAGSNWVNVRFHAKGLAQGIHLADRLEIKRDGVLLASQPVQTPHIGRLTGAHKTQTPTQPNSQQQTRKIMPMRHAPQQSIQPA